MDERVPRPAIHTDQVLARTSSSSARDKTTMPECPLARPRSDQQVKFHGLGQSDPQVKGAPWRGTPAVPDFTAIHKPCTSCEIQQLALHTYCNLHYCNIVLQHNKPARTRSAPTSIESHAQFDACLHPCTDRNTVACYCQSHTLYLGACCCIRLTYPCLLVTALAFTHHSHHGHTRALHSMATTSSHRGRWPCALLAMAMMMLCAAGGAMAQDANNATAVPMNATADAISGSSGEQLSADSTP
jgi:hypothetical protein